MPRHFISYSSADAQEFARRLAEALEAGPPALPVWLDQRDLRPGRDWDEAIAEALKTCLSFIFVMTPDSVEDRSECKREWTYALRYKKQIIPLKLHPAAEAPFRLGPRQHIDFTRALESDAAFDAALARLREHLVWLASPAGALRAMQDQLADARRDLRRASDHAQRARVQDDIDRLALDIARQEEVVRDPLAAERRVEQSIARGLEREREHAPPAAGDRRGRFINPPPALAPAYFQNRELETDVLGGFLKNEALRLVTVVGRGGVGKTALVCRLLRSLEEGRLPDGGRLDVDGIVYLTAAGSRRLNTPNLYADLSKLLPEEAAAQLYAFYKQPQVSTEAKMQALLSHFTRGRTVVLLDNFEDVVTPETLSIRDAELSEALRALLNLPHHTVKVMLTTRIAPPELTLVQPGRQRRLDLDEGLASPYAENILREMDADGKVGLRGAPDDLLKEARERTRGYPRALEALFASLSADRDTTLRDILDDTAGVLPQNVVHDLVGEAFSRLDPAAQQVMQALAVYAHPVTHAAVDYLLQPHLPGIDSAPVLKRLVNMKFASRESSRYYLHREDRAYARSRVPRGGRSDRLEEAAPPYTQFALSHRAAEYFKQSRTPRETWRTIEDVAPQLAEFDLRCAGEDFARAADVLLEIDFDHLFTWGYYRLAAEMHERLQGKLDDPEQEGRSAGNLGAAYRNTGQVQKAVPFFERALELVRGRRDRQGEGAWLGNLGLCAADLGQLAKAVEFHEQALAISREVGDRKGEAINLGNLGNCYKDLGRVERAVEFHEQALAINREIGRRLGEAADLGNLGNCYSNLGQVERAIEFHEQGLALSREVGDRKGEAADLGNLGNCYADLGSVGRAVEYYEQALAICREVGDRQGEAINLGNLGRRYAELGQAERAVEFHERALAINREIGDLIGEAINLSNLGNRYAAAGQFERAVGLYERALALDRESGRRWGEGVNLGNLGDSYAARGEAERSVGFYEQAVAVAREVGNREGESINLSNLGNLYAGLGQFGRAIECQERALAIDRELGRRQGEAINVGNLGNRYAETGHIERAVEYYERALAICREIGDRKGESINLSNLGNRCGDTGRVQQSVAYYEQALAIDRELGRRDGEAVNLGNLAIRYSDLGQTELAVEYHERALAISRELGDRPGEGLHLGNLAEVLVNLNSYPEAVGKAIEGVKIADEVKSPRLGSYNNGYLALARLCAGDLEGARAAAEAAARFDEPTNNHWALALLGLVALRQGEGAAARRAFEGALEEAATMLARCARNYHALDSKGLALCGLALCGDAARVTEAAGAYRAARAINKDVGVVGRVLRTFDALAEADAAGALAGVRAAAGASE